MRKFWEFDVSFVTSFLFLVWSYIWDCFWGFFSFASFRFNVLVIDFYLFDFFLMLNDHWYPVKRPHMHLTCENSYKIRNCKDFPTSGSNWQKREKLNTQMHLCEKDRAFVIKNPKLWKHVWIISIDFDLFSPTPIPFCDIRNHQARICQ